MTRPRFKNFLYVSRQEWVHTSGTDSPVRIGVIAAHFVRAVVFGVVFAPRGQCHGYTGPRGHLYFLV